MSTPARIQATALTICLTTIVLALELLAHEPVSIALVEDQDSADALSNADIEVLVRARERGAQGVPGGVYKSEGHLRARIPTREELKQAVDYVETLRGEALLARSVEESQLRDAYLRAVTRMAGVPIAMESAATLARYSGRIGHRQVTYETEESWESKGNWVQVDGEARGPDIHLIRNRHGLWSQQPLGSDGAPVWSLREDEDERGDAFGYVLFFLMDITRIAEIAIADPAAVQADVFRGTGESASRFGFSIEMRIMSLVDALFGYVHSLPAGWKDVAGRVAVSIEERGDVEHLSITWSDLNGRIVRQSELWCVGSERIPRRLLRRDYTLGGTEVLNEYEVHVWFLGPVESSPAEFIPPPGSLVMDSRFGDEVMYRVMPDGSLPRAKELVWESRARELEISSLLQRASRPNAGAAVGDSKSTGDGGGFIPNPSEDADTSSLWGVRLSRLARTGGAFIGIVLLLIGAIWIRRAAAGRAPGAES